MTRTSVFAAALILPAMFVSGCSEETQERAQATAEGAAADTAANAEVIGEELREGAIVAADEVSEGAAELRDELAENEANDTDPSDNELDGTD
ncbi:hypothetical protein [Erythrobacter alti]|uniref:hypothetical protein n=1 Tax=Erythrobacter alti TaxID=1896145 RepID=UPI0030F392FF